MFRNLDNSFDKKERKHKPNCANPEEIKMMIEPSIANPKAWKVETTNQNQCYSTKKLWLEDTEMEFI